MARHHDLESWFVKVFLQLVPQVPDQIVLDLDATDDPLHGHQLGRFFHGYYKHYCYLPLYVFCGEHLLCAKLRPADIDASAGSVRVVQRIVAEIRQQWPQVRILLRGDSGFCRETLMRWCEENGVDYLFGLAKNARLQRIIGRQMHEAQLEFEATGQPCRKFTEFSYQTRKSWSRSRRVVAKAEHLAKGFNPRFVVTSLTADECEARTLYEERYCGRGEMENRIKEQQLCLFADRTSCHSMRANQLRLWLSSAAYVLLQALRERGLAKTEMAHAQLRYDSPEAAQDRRGGASHGAACVGLVVGKLSLPTVIPSSARQPTEVESPTTRGPFLNCASAHTSHVPSCPHKGSAGCCAEQLASDCSKNHAASLPSPSAPACTTADLTHSRGVANRNRQAANPTPKPITNPRCEKCGLVLCHSLIFG